MMYETNEDIIKGDFHCPRCGEMMREKKPMNDRFLVRNKERVVRLLCPCGHYEDKTVTDPNQFYEKNNDGSRSDGGNNVVLKSGPNSNGK